MAERGQGPEDAGIADKHVKPAETLVQRKTKPVDAVVVLEVERDESGGTSGSLDRVIELLEPTNGASDRHDVGAGIRQGQRSGVADPARSAGDERNATGERRRHLQISWPRRGATVAAAMRYARAGR